KLFHGVQAIRLNPVDRDRMYGRDGMLAHTYMLGPNGQSNGCVSFKNYDKFLQAFLKGEVDRLVVVGELGNTSWRTAARQAGPRPGPPRRYAAYSEAREAPKSERSFWTW
ncbi:MAG: tlde1 domain-containing protein, partial [Hyphomicrobiales bacterium]